MTTSPQIRAVTFDCSGALIDSVGRSGTFLGDLALRQQDPDPEPGSVLCDRLEAMQFELVHDPYHRYRDVLAESLRRYVVERGYPWDPDDATANVRSMGCWQPVPDTRPALPRAHEEVR